MISKVNVNVNRCVGTPVYAFCVSGFVLTFQTHETRVNSPYLFQVDPKHVFIYNCRKTRRKGPSKPSATMLLKCLLVMFPGSQLSQLFPGSQLFPRESIFTSVEDTKSMAPPDKVWGTQEKDRIWENSLNEGFVESLAAFRGQRDMGPLVIKVTGPS